jgi:hypothetical protein
MLDDGGSSRPLLRPERRGVPLLPELMLGRRGELLRWLALRI